MKKALLLLTLTIVTLFGETAEDLKKYKDIIDEKTKQADKSALEWAWSVLFRQHHIGAKRLDDELPNTLPVGDVLLMENGLIVGVFPDDNAKLKNLKIIDSKTKKVVFQRKEVKKLTYIPAEQLNYGHEYIIKSEIVYPDHIVDFQDSFRVVPKKDHMTFYKKLNTLVSKLKYRSVKNFIEAVYFFDQGFDYNGFVKILQIQSNTFK